jgi:Zn-dependent protease with chaperone function
MLIRMLLAAALAVAASAAYPAPPDAGERAAASVGTDIVLRAAEIAYSRDLARARAKGTLDVEQAQLRSLRVVLQPLLYTAGAVNGEAKAWRWAMSIETRADPVAYCLPGGKILVSTGLFDRTRLTLPEAGVVLAHAIAHALAGHDADEAVARYLREGGVMGADPNGAVARLAQIIAEITVSEPHEVAGERAADTLALELMARSGVDPRPSVDAWRKLTRAGGTVPPAFLALHPPWPERIGEIEAQLPRMVMLYETTLGERRPPAEGSVPLPIPGRR